VADDSGRPRRGRKEGSLDPAWPEHRRLFAQRLRALRGDCNNPAYRTLSKLSHCGSGSLSDAAGGRRFPTWETTRGYVTGCLRYAGRDHEVDRLLAHWRRWWEESSAFERAFREHQRQASAAAVTGPRRTAVEEAGRSDVPARQSGPTAGSGISGPPDASPGASLTLTRSQRPAWRRWPSSRFKALAATLTLLMIGLVDDGAAHPRPAMTGLYNVAVAPFQWSGPAPRSDLATRLETALFGELKHWSQGLPAIQLRAPQDVAAIEPPEAPARDRSFAAVAQEHGADVVVTGLLHASAGRLTVTIELFLTDRAFGETPEFVGRHEISVTEPLDVFSQNVTFGEDLAEGTVRQVKGVVAFVRGLGDYARDDFVRAESRFLQAAEEFDLVDRLPGRHTLHKEVLYLMLGNAVGRGDIARVNQSAGHYRQALIHNPGYLRAKIGLAEATRAAVPCRPQQKTGRSLRLALETYRAALASGQDGGGANQVLLEMKTHLGLGLTYQCLAIAREGSYWAHADNEFAAVLRLGVAKPPVGEGVRHSLRLAAEARAGQALIAFMTADQPGAAQFGGYPAAAEAYEEALQLLGRIDVTRPTNVQRELTFLRNLRSVYRAMHESARLAEVDERIAATSTRLVSMEDRGWRHGN
jgi:hypothetical protein